MQLEGQGGFLVVDKPAGKTSHDIVGMCRRVLRTREVGHTGTLDPFATGVLVVMAGQLTRAADLVGAGTKRYAATARLGVETTTDDLQGEAVRTASVDVTEAALREALLRFTGPLRQVPPAFSAKHVDGERAHELARRGERVELPAVDVTVHSLELRGRRGDDVDFDVECSRGTYIRAIARDLGRALGCGAHLVALRRTRVGTFTQEHAVPATDLAPHHLRPARELADLLPMASVDDDGWLALKQGRAARAYQVGPRAWPAGAGGVVTHGDHLVALATARGDLVAGSSAPAALLDVGRRFPTA